MNNYLIQKEEKAFNDFESAHKIAITAKTFVSGKGKSANDKAREFIKALQMPRKMDGENFIKFLSDDSSFRVEKSEDGKKWNDMVSSREIAERYALKSMHITSDLIHGTINENPILARTFTKGLITQPENYPVVASFSSLQAMQDMDMQWMRVFNSIDMRGMSIGKIVDFIGEIAFKEITAKQPIEYSNIGYDTAVDVTKRMFGGGASLEMDMLNQNPAYSINQALIGIRAASEAKKAKLAYAAMYDSANFNATTNYDATGSTVVAKDIITLNTAAEATLAAFAATKNGVSVTPNTIMYFVCNPTFKTRIDSALSSVRGTDGTNTIVAYNIVPIYSYLMPVQPSASTNGGMLMVPGQKNIFATFSDLLSNQESHFDTQRLKIGGIEKYNVVVEENKQNRFVKLA